MKKISVLGLFMALSVVLTGCGTEEDKLVNLATEAICYMVDVTAEMEKDPEAAMSKFATMEKDLEDMMKDHGFENEEAVDAAYEKIEDKDAFADKVMAKAEKKCDIPEEMKEMMDLGNGPF